MKKNLHHPPEEIRIAMAMGEESRCRRRNKHCNPSSGDNDFSPPPRETNRYISNYDPEIILKQWINQPQHILRQHPAPSAAALILASRYGDRIAIHYQSSNATLIRRISPEYLFTKHPNSPVYVRAFCHHRKEMRTFRLDRLTIL